MGLLKFHLRAAIRKLFLHFEALKFAPLKKSSVRRHCFELPSYNTEVRISKHLLIVFYLGQLC